MLQRLNAKTIAQANTLRCVPPSPHLFDHREKDSSSPPDEDFRNENCHHLAVEQNWLHVFAKGKTEVLVQDFCERKLLNFVRVYIYIE